MTIIKTEELKNLNIKLDENKKRKLEEFARIFLEKNSQINLISKNEEKYLFEKHIYDSLALNLAISPLRGETLLDIGTGGGFPSIPVSILFENLSIYGMDSIKKKIKVIEEIKQELDIKNLYPVCKRAEDDDKTYDYVTCRAVSAMENLVKYATFRVKQGGLFIAYKSQKVEEEIKQAEKLIKKSGLKLIKTIEYTLPTEEKFTRNLVVFKKQK